MRTDLPWNVAGIPPEAREAARAAARREGLSVGEWLTRRILRSFSDLGEESPPPMAENWNIPSGPSRRDTEDMLAHVSRSESETNDLSRRIEEQLRGVARRLDAAERSQSENNRAMSRAAAEINVATREQSQAFDQLGSHVVGLSDRIERVERHAGDSSMKDAVKGLHQGLSRLADQISQTANQSATQVSTLAQSLEQLAARLAHTRQETESVSRALDHRLAAVEKAAESNAHTLDRAIEAFQDRANARSSEQSSTASAIAKLEENIGLLESRLADPDLDRRLIGIERTLSDIVARMDAEQSNNPVEDTIRRLSQKLESVEKRHDEEVDELRAAVTHASGRLAAVETSSHPFSGAAAASSFAPPPQAFEAPPFPDAAPLPPPFQAPLDSFAPPPFDAGDFGMDNQFPPIVTDPFAPPPPTPPSVDSYLTAARRSARAAAASAEAERRPLGGFSWTGGQASQAGVKKPRSRYTLPALIGAILVLALIAGMTLTQRMADDTAATDLGSAFVPTTDVPAAVDTPNTSSPAPATTTPAAPAMGARITPAPPNTKAPQAALPPTQSRDMRAAPVLPVPAAPVAASQGATPAPQAAQQAKPPQAPTTALDRLTALANNGNAVAETIVGFRYLEGEGVAASPVQAAKWLERAAEQGQAVAQSRLGQMYEEGQGVTKDLVKAARWYQAAAAQGNRIAMHNLALTYVNGAGQKKDLAEGVRWFLRAASLGVADSQFNLAVLYESGQGVPQSLLDAYKWYLIAAAQGDRESKARVDALRTQLGADDRAAAERSASGFKAAAMNRKANVVPQLSDLGSN